MIQIGCSLTRLLIVCLEGRYLSILLCRFTSFSLLGDPLHKGSVLSCDAVELNSLLYLTLNAGNSGVMWQVSVAVLCYASVAQCGRALLLADSRVFSKVSLLLHSQLSTSPGEPSRASHCPTTCGLPSMYRNTCLVIKG